MEAILKYRKVSGEFEPTLTVGVQTFMFGRRCETEQEAKWYCDMMRNALDNLSKPELCVGCCDEPRSEGSDYCNKCIQNALTDVEY